MLWAGYCPAVLCAAAIAAAGWFTSQETGKQLQDAAHRASSALATSIASEVRADPGLIEKPALLSSLLSEAASGKDIAALEVIEAETDRVIARASPAVVSPVAARHVPISTVEGAGYVVRVRSGAASTKVPLWTVFGPAAGIAGFGALVFVYTAGGLRKRLHVLHLIAGALDAVSKHDRETAALELEPSLGSETQGWNALLGEREALLEQISELRAQSSGPAETGEAGVELEAACDAMWDGVLIADRTGSVLYANGAAGVLLGTGGGRSIREAIPDSDAAQELSELAASGTKRRAVFEFELGENDPPSVVQVAARGVVSDASAATLVAVVRDVTQQRIAEKSRNSFIAQVTHELRTPLTNIRLYVEEAADAGDSDPAVLGRAINVINQESRRLERIVGDMLSVAEIEAGAMTLRIDDVRLEQLFGDLQNEFASLASERSIEIRWDLPPKFPVLRGDRDKVVLAVHNVVGNALKYTPEEGRVTVRLDASEAGFTCEVADTGPGIDPDEQDRVFEKFYRAETARGAGVTGTGLGLPLAREVARLHGGDITLESVVGEGCTFTIVIPNQADGRLLEAA